MRGVFPLHGQPDGVYLSAHRQKILFFGTDDPGKLKSLKLPFGAVGICWFEELDQFDGPEEVRNVEQTVLRGGSWTLTLKELQPAGHGPQLG